MKITVIGFLIFLLTAPLPAAAQNSPRLAWAPPALVNPTRIEIRRDGNSIDIVRHRADSGRPQASRLSADARVSIKLDPAEDAVIELPHDRPLEIPGLMVLYGHNVRMIGGALKATAPAIQSSKALLRFAGTGGSVFVEGVEIDANGQYGLDGLDVGSVQNLPGAIADIYVQNCRLVNTYSTRDGYHADAYQFYGSTGWTRMDRVSVEAEYQGVFLMPQANVGGIDLRHVDLRYTDPGKATGYLFFLRSEFLKNPRHPPVHLEDVYVGDATNRGKWEDWAIYPPANRENGALIRGNEATFPAFPEVEGHVTKGAPPDGPFVKDGGAGVNYVSPGYRGERD